MVSAAGIAGVNNKFEGEKMEEVSGCIKDASDTILCQVRESVDAGLYAMQWLGARPSPSPARGERQGGP
jgi:hypothetical protein